MSIPPYMTPKSIVEETVEFYARHPRSLANPRDVDDWDGVGVLVQARDDGKLCCCAMGRCLSKPREFLNVPVVEGVFDEHLKRQYRGHPDYFWWSLMHLHDKNIHWTSKWRPGHELTKEGEKKIESILREYPSVA